MTVFSWICLIAMVSGGLCLAFSSLAAYDKIKQRIDKLEKELEG
tara:strand:+ start:1176 stop:1307 length:132 start_codon:yes stop_codon:yes gene_type:complete